MGRGQKISIFVSRGTGRPCAIRQADWSLRWALGKIDAHTDAIETGVGAARILHMGAASGCLWPRRKAERGCLRNAQVGGQNG